MDGDIYLEPIILMTPTSRAVLFELSERHLKGQPGDVLIANAEGKVCGKVCGSQHHDGIHVTVDGVAMDQFALQKYLQEVVL